MYDYLASAGPVVWQDDDGEWRAACARRWGKGGLIKCISLRYGRPGEPDRCEYVKPPQPLQDRGDDKHRMAPQWCPLAASMIRDSRLAMMLEEHGWIPDRKGDLLQIVKHMPRGMKPKDARRQSIWKLQNAIQDAVENGWELPNGWEIKK